MAIKFGGSSTGYTVSSPTFDMRTFDCGTDYKIFINRIDKVCRTSSQVSDGLCALKEVAENLKTQLDGDCIQRISITVNEVPYNPVLEAVTPCAEIGTLNRENALLKVAEMGSCNPGVKAMEVSVAINGFGEGKTALDTPELIINELTTRLNAWSISNDILTEAVDWVILVGTLGELWMPQDYGYDAPMDDFHTFNTTARAVIPLPTDRIDVPTACQIEGEDPKTRTGRITVNIDLNTGIIRADKEITAIGAFPSRDAAILGIDTYCS